MKKVNYPFIYFSIYCKILLMIAQNTLASHRGQRARRMFDGEVGERILK